MPNFFSEAQQIIEQDSHINSLIRKAKIQRQALIAVRESLNLKNFSTIKTLEISNVYCDAKILKIYCKNSFIASKLKPFTLELLQHLKHIDPLLFSSSIQKIKILVSPITE